MRLDAKITKNETPIRRKLSRYSSQTLIEALTLLARPAKKRRAKRKRNPSHRTGTRGADFEAESETDPEQIDPEDIDYANEVIAVPDFSESWTSSKGLDSQRRTDSQVPQGTGQNSQLIDREAPAVDPRPSLATPTDTVDTFPPPSTLRLLGFEAPGVNDRPCDGVGMLPPPVASHLLEFEALILNNRPCDGVGIFLPPRSLRSFDLDSYSGETRYKGP